MKGDSCAGFGWVLVLVALSAPLACEGRDVLQSTTHSSAANPPPILPDASAPISPQVHPIAPAERPLAPADPSASAVARAHRRLFAYVTSPDNIKGALGDIGWTPIGSRVGSIKGAECITVIASRKGMIAEVRLFLGYPEGLQDMLELKGTAQGFGDMSMFTVIVKGDAARTDQLYEQLMDSAPERHGTGLGDPYNWPGSRR